MSSKDLILVTGINGFLGAHIVDQLVKAGYRVRGTVRSAKVASVQQNNSIYGADVEVVGADDLALGDFTDILKGVSGVIHAAAPLIGRAEPEDALRTAVEGAVNILRQTEKAGIKRFVLVSSVITVRLLGDPAEKWTEDDWVETSKEQALASKDPTFVYVSEKVLAERAVWEFAEKHPHLNVTTINPSFFIGPFAPNYRFTDALISQLSTNVLLYQLLNPDGTFLGPTLMSIDVRDVARATVHALSVAPSQKRKRVLISPHSASWKEVAEFVAEARPHLKDRISKHALSGTEYPHPVAPSPVDNAKAVELLKLGQLTDWKTAVLEAVDAVLRVEAEFAKEGKTFHEA